MLGLGAVGACLWVVSTLPGSVRWGRGVDPGLRTARGREEPGMFAVGFLPAVQEDILSSGGGVVMNGYFSPFSWFFIIIIVKDFFSTGPNPGQLMTLYTSSNCILTTAL